MVDIIGVLLQWVLFRNPYGCAVKKKKKKKLVEKLHKPVTRKFEKQNVYFIFIDNIWGADFANV